MVEATSKKVSVIFKRPPQVKSASQKKNVAVYCRVSTSSDEQLHSFNAQLNYYSKLFENDENRQLYRIYADEGISGTQTAKRVEFLQMIADCEKGLIDYVITKSISRFGRNTVDSLVYTRKLRELGIDVYFEKEEIHSINPEGELMLAILSTLAETESVNISEAVKWGVRRCYEKGKVESLTLGKFYGYYKKGKEIVVIEDEAKVVRRIYKSFLDGYSIYEIARKLTEEGIPTDTGNDIWGETTLKKILRNEKYKGDCLFQKTFIADPITHKRTRNDGQLNKYYAEDCIPPIIDRDLWELVNLEFDRQVEFRKKHKIARYHASKHDFPLACRIICSVCGRTYQVLQHKIKSKNGERYWRCTSFHHKQWTEIPDLLFTPREKPLRKEPGQRKRKYYTRILPQPRIMRCTDIEIPEEAPYKAFITTWNKLVEEPQILENHIPQGVLEEYRFKELKRLIKEHGKINSVELDFIQPVLESIVVNLDGSFNIHFLAGIEIKVKI